MIKVTLYHKAELSEVNQILLKKAFLDGSHAKSVEMFPVLDIANEPDAFVVANIISLKNR